jgi:hypothetical protein
MTTPLLAKRRASKLKVYGWQEGGTQSVILAAPSQAECARARGFTSASQLFNISATGNEEEVRVAQAKPGTLFTRKLSVKRGTPWAELPRKDAGPGPAKTPKVTFTEATIYAVYEDRGKDKLQLFCAKGRLSSAGAFTADEATGMAFRCGRRFHADGCDFTPEAAVARFHDALRIEIDAAERNITDARATLAAPINMKPKATR